jgi:protein-S-isoprenylcysteine O-methyltransferase Ste14
MSQMNLNVRIMVRVVIGFIFISAFLFGTAGTFSWPEAWLYIIIQFSYSIGISFWFKKNYPEFLKDRMTSKKKSAKSWDKTLKIGTIPFFIALLIVPGLDAVRYQWSQVSFALKTIGFIVIIASLALIFLVRKEDASFSRVGEIQKEQQHKLITTGPYKYVRHPMYVAVIFLFVFLPLALGSLYGLIPAAFLVIAIIIRTHLEDKTFHKELPGYKEYAKKTKYRLLPGIW